MPLVKIEYPMRVLGLESPQSIETLCKRGLLTKHHLPVTSRNLKRRPVRFDKDQVDALERKIKGEGLPVATDAPLPRQRESSPAATLTAPTPKPPSARRTVVQRRRPSLSKVRHYE